jgi:hypothetical protein
VAEVRALIQEHAQQEEQQPAVVHPAQRLCIGSARSQSSSAVARSHIQTGLCYVMS